MTFHTLIRGGALACALLCAPALSFAQGTESTPSKVAEQVYTEASLEAAKKKVGALLSGHHHQPTPDQIKAASPRARAALAALALDEDLFLLYRRRALTALTSTWPDESSRKLLESLLAAEDDALVLESLNLLIKHHDSRGVEVLTATLLDSPFATHRRAAIHALAHLPVDQQQALIARALDKEQDPDNRTLLTFKAKDLAR